MKTVTAASPYGRDWEVRVVWQPRWRALARRFGGWRRERKRKKDSGGWGNLDLPTGGSDDIFAVIMVIVGVILFGLVFWFFLLPLALLIVDVIVVIALTVLAIPARVLFRRPWRVEASSADTDGSTETWFGTEVVGWRRALDTRDEIAQKLREGYPPPIVGSLAVREA